MLKCKLSRGIQFSMHKIILDVSRKCLGAYIQIILTLKLLHSPFFPLIIISILVVFKLRLPGIRIEVSCYFNGGDLVFQETIPILTGWSYSNQGYLLFTLRWPVIPMKKTLYSNRLFLFSLDGRIQTMTAWYSHWSGFLSKSRYRIRTENTLFCINGAS